MNIYKRYFKKYRFSFLAAISFVFFEAICDLLQPTIMARIIDDGVRNGKIEVIVRFGVIMLLVTGFGACFAITRSIIASRVSQSFGADLRYEVFDKIMHFSEVSADKIESGSLITRMTNDTSQITQFINGMMRIFFKAPVTCIGSIILAVMLSPYMSLILFAVVAVVGLLIVISMKLSYKRFAKVQYAIDKVNTVVQEYLMGIRLVKAFGRYDEEKDKFNYVNMDLFNKSVSSSLVIAYFSPLLSLTVSLGIASVVYAGSVLFMNGVIGVGKVTAFISYMTQILMSLIMITNIFNTFVRTKASSERINEILDSSEDFKGSENPESEELKDLEFKNVTFAYPAGSLMPALRDISFKVSKGETLAVIGPTGSGKSTLAWLCLRFYDVDKGTISLNGKDIRLLDCSRLRADIALAPQKSMLFTGTVADNISWGRRSASEKEIMEAAKMAQADEFVKNMPAKYNSVLGQGGVNLSGGQKQRISIARAIAKKSDIMIFDDCTSALDAVTEAKVRQELKKLKDKKIIIMITQRVGTAMFADKILVLDNGQNVGLGSHKELLNSCETYRGIFDSQIGSDLKR